MAVAGLRIFTVPSIPACRARFWTQAAICHLINPLEFLIDLLAELKRVEGPPKLVQLRDSRCICLPASQDPLQGSLCGIIDPANFRAHANFLHQLDRGQIQVEP